MSKEKTPEKKEESPKEPEIEEVTIEEIKPEDIIEETKDGKETNADFWELLFEKAIPLADKYLSFKKDDSEAKRKYFETVSRHNRRMMYVLVAFLIAIVAFMSVLTIYGLVSGDALLFLVGTITGYLLLFIQRLVFPSKEEPTVEEVPT